MKFSIFTNSTYEFYNSFPKVSELLILIFFPEMPLKQYLKLILNNINKKNNDPAAASEKEKVISLLMLLSRRPSMTA